jgi:DNA-directed RNA polymerase subunit RPC12/RpoP
MTSRRDFIHALIPLSAALVLTSCKTAEPPIPTEAAAHFKATGATVVDADKETVKIHIKCPRCGYTTEMEIPKPTADKPYSKEWKCPRCGCRVKITVEVEK